MDKSDWEKRFQALAAAGSEAPARQPDALVEEIGGRRPALWPGLRWPALRWPALKTRRALDLGCGAGANALWLAENGWDVTAVDRSPAAIDIVQVKARERGLRVITEIADLEAHEFPIATDAWDMILMCRYLQRDLFEPARRGLAPGGVLIAIALLAEPGKERFRVRPGELATCFAASAGWTIVHQREGATRDHRVAEIVVRRTAGGPGPSEPRQ